MKLLIIKSAEHILFLGICLLVAMGLSCGPGRVLVISENEIHPFLQAAVGETFQLKLKSQLSTGFSWKITAQSDILKLAGKPEIESPKEKRPGSAEFQLFTFTAVKKGEGEIVFHYVRPWEKKAKPEKTLTVKVKVE